MQSEYFGQCRCVKILKQNEIHRKEQLSINSKRDSVGKQIPIPVLLYTQFCIYVQLYKLPSLESFKGKLPWLWDMAH